MNSVSLRAATAGLIAVAAVTALTSCSSLGLTGSVAAAPPSDSSAVVDPSVQQSSDAPSASAVTPSEGDSPTPTPTPSASVSLAAVVPFVTSATSSGGAIAVTALVPKVVEQGGTCTLVATKDGATQQAESGAVATSSYVGCNPLTIPAAQLGAGTWTVQVSYVSASSSGTSKPQTVEVH